MAAEDALCHLVYVIHHQLIARISRIPGVLEMTRTTEASASKHAANFSEWVIHVVRNIYSMYVRVGHMFRSAIEMGR